tara:strand:+ start:16 stop:465 length:450 start_codon:yes stop_codon:yes gene_type:complete
MTGQINVNKIAARTGTTITIDTGDALDVTLVKGEGAATTNLKQGLHKHWGTFGMDDGAIDDSLNMSSTTDIAGGQYNVNITTAMANTNFAVDFMPLYVNGNGTSIVKYNNTGLTNGVTTTAAGLYTWRTDTGSPVDPTFVHSFIVGDLA